MTDAAFQDFSLASRAVPDAGARNGAIDALRLVAAAAIVHFHLGLPGRDLSLSGLSLFAILVVFYGARRSAADRTRRLLWPWLFWSGVYAALLAGQSILRGDGALDWVKGWMVLAGPSIHLWFLPFAALLLAVQARLRPAGLPVLAGLGAIALWAAALAGLPVPLAQWVSVLPAAWLGLVMQRCDRPALVAALGGAGFLALSLSPWPGPVFQTGLAALLVAAALHWPRATTPLTCRLGAVSFGVYLLHPAVIAVAARGPQMPGLALWAVVFLVSALTAAALRPFLAPRFI